MYIPATSAPAKQSNLSGLAVFGAGGDCTNLGPAGGAGMGVKKGMGRFPSCAYSLDLPRQVGPHFWFILWIPHEVFNSSDNNTALAETYAMLYLH